MEIGNQCLRHSRTSEAGDAVLEHANEADDADGHACDLHDERRFGFEVVGGIGLELSRYRELFLISIVTGWCPLS